MSTGLPLQSDYDSAATQVAADQSNAALLNGAANRPAITALGSSFNSTGGSAYMLNVLDLAFLATGQGATALAARAQESGLWTGIGSWVAPCAIAVAHGAAMETN